MKLYIYIPPPYSRTSRVWDSLLGVREVVGSRPGRGNSKESFSSNQETGKVFSPDALLFQILKKSEIRGPRGGDNDMMQCVIDPADLYPKLCIYKAK